MKNRQAVYIWIALIFTGCAVSDQVRLNKKYGDTATAERSRQARQAQGIDFLMKVKPVLERRCAVCHACYDAPCQLNLTSYEGLERGATKKNVYDTGRVVEASPIRLGLDAQSAEEWRHKDFHPVLNERTQTPEANQAASVLARMLNLKAANPLPQTPVLPPTLDFSINRKQQCPAIEDFDSFVKKYPLWGMPYGMPGLTKDQSHTLLEWVAQGAPYTDPPPADPANQKRIAEWEKFFNGDSNKEQLMSRYLFEHLFLAHFYFDDLPQGEYFDFVRSKTPPGKPLELVNRRRAYEDPKVPRVYYRLHRVDSTIVAKRHLPYALNAKRMARWKELFLTPNYEVKNLPSYEDKVASNPFASFKDIPVKSRYQMMLDEAQFTIMGFIKGPVCRGQVALNVIQDQFWMVFVNPEMAGDQEFANFFAENSEYLALPAKNGSQAMVLGTWMSYSKLQKKYLERKADFIRTHLKDPSNYTLNTIWDGGGTNPNAALTIFRHFDSASVVKGFVGEPPKTSLVVGYALLERIHYLLVAGYDVYGNVGHQVSTRLYMDFLRMEAESHFLSLLPKDARMKERDFWYKDAKADVKEYVYGIRAPFETETGIKYETDNPKAELYNKLKRHLWKVLDKRYNLSGNVKDIAILSELNRLSRITGLSISILPEVSVLNIRGVGYFTLLRNSAHTNITSLLDQKKQRQPDQDTLTVVPGFIGDYPEVFLEVEPKKLSDFVDAVIRLNKEDDYAALLNTFGIRRTDSRFWETSDVAQEANLQSGGPDAGLLDYNRYQNR